MDLRTWAERLKDSTGARILEETLQEEKKADEKLTNIAESSSNVRAEKSGQFGTLLACVDCGVSGVLNSPPVAAFPR